MLSDWKGSVNIMCYPNEHQNVVFSVHSWARSTFQSAYKPNFRFLTKSSVFTSGLLGELYIELFNEGISKNKMWAKMFPEIMLWKRMGLETDQNIFDTYFLISKRVQGGSPANRGLAPLARFWYCYILPRYAPSSGSDMKKYPAFPAVWNASRGLEVLYRSEQSHFFMKWEIRGAMAPEKILREMR